MENWTTYKENNKTNECKKVRDAPVGLPRNSAQTNPNAASESVQKVTSNKTTTLHNTTVQIGLILEMVWSKIFAWYYEQCEKIMLYAIDNKWILVADGEVTTKIRRF